MCVLEYIFIECQLYPSILSSNRPLHMPDLILKLYIFKFILYVLFPLRPAK